jgi:hypothetical protein
MHILSLSDEEVPFIYSPVVRDRFSGTDLILGCGDLQYYYLEYVTTMLNAPTYYVRGNHAHEVEYTSGGEKRAPLGAVDLHRRTVNHNGLLLAGVEGSVRYSNGPYQYTQTQMWGHVLRLVPGLLRNRIFYGRYLDIFVTHAPPWHIHDQPDRAHRGIQAFRWLDITFQPEIHFHGHVRPVLPSEPTETLLRNTWVINTYGYVETSFELGSETRYAPERRDEGV